MIEMDCLRGKDNLRLQFASTETRETSRCVTCPLATEHYG